MTKFLESVDHSPEQKLEFIRRQYALMDIIIKVLDGKVFFQGCSQPSHHED